MVHVNFTTEEAFMLRDILSHYVSDLRMEIANTDAMDFRDMLKLKKAFLTKLMDTLQTEMTKEQQSSPAAP